MDDIECANLLNDAFKHRKELKKYIKINGFNNTLKAPQDLKVLKVKEHAKKWGFLIAEIPKILVFQKERI